MTYCTITQCFTKCFFSIKGIYYQIELMGVKITWLAPYQFNQRLPFDIDYKVIGTFREFYTALLRFVNYRLFTDLGIPYQNLRENIIGLSDESNNESSLFLDSPQIRSL